MGADAIDAERSDMEGEAPGAEEALCRLEEQQRNLEMRRIALEQAAANELGHAVIHGGGLTLEADQLQQLVERAVALGMEEALRRLNGEAAG
jgi:hypothetical protein